jgi:guanylate kinase
MKIVVLTAPSGAGKTTIARRLLQAFPTMRFSVSATTRAPRPSEKHGVDYFFLTEEEFKRRLEKDEFVEHEEVYPGLLYGTLKSELEKGTAEAPVLLDIDVRGALRVKESFGDNVRAIYIKPPSVEALIERLKLRATDSVHDLKKREARFHFEAAFENRFDYVVINDDLETAVEETIDIVTTFLLATSEKSAE